MSRPESDLDVVLAALNVLMGPDFLGNHALFQAYLDKYYVPEKGGS